MYVYTCLYEHTSDFFLIAKLEYFYLQEQKDNLLPQK